jgi:hypothetical protein
MPHVRRPTRTQRGTIGGDRPATRRRRPLGGDRPVPRRGGLPSFPKDAPFRIVTPPGSILTPPGSLKKPPILPKTPGSILTPPGSLKKPPILTPLSLGKSQQKRQKKRVSTSLQGTRVPVSPMTVKRAEKIIRDNRRRTLGRR